MDPSHGPELADDLEKSRQKRSRTGCLTCRNRRRKCDEGKPRCQNCISKGLECKHAAAFQILGKNNFTPALPSEGKEGYAELQFVPENGDKGDNKKRKNNAKGGTDIPGAPSPDLGLAGPQLASPNDDRSFEGLQGARSHSPSTERYEFALHGLLALGSANGGDVEECEADYGTMVLPESQNVALPNDANVILNRARQESNANNAATMQATPSMSALSSVSIPQMASEHVLECFRHYRYNIAPWMDICDMSQCFGGEVLQLSMASPEIHCEILALAEASIDARQRLRSLGAGMLPSMQQDNDNSTINAHQRLADLLHIVRAVVTNLSEFWNREDATRSMQQVLEPALVDVNKNPSCKESLTPARFWLTARLRKWCPCS
ncbi:hypothetical protein BU23DRAFT_515466 [Bimuria novae-zelandiae CBS 107.79]|uniref:Zn(2)-C6 fungal-type domain-containing protein n=1 Tax=Bimuria novae-zelandiae CBS 107.79 TaxID=1447943 RepID=A0A6A5USX2_9PLEO|nr:hypothetical protein BU23DRAFT_515466 [Bimuria novae-zelandiae CBS 107.79]